MYIYVLILQCEMRRNNKSVIRFEQNMFLSARDLKRMGLIESTLFDLRRITLLYPQARDRKRGNFHSYVIPDIDPPLWQALSRSHP